MVGTPLLQPAPSLSGDTCVHVVTRPAVAGSGSASLDLTLDLPEPGGLEEDVVAAVDQVKDLKPSDLLHVTLLSTNNCTTIKSTQSNVALPPKLDKKDTHSEEIFCHRLPGSLIYTTPFYRA